MAISMISPFIIEAEKEELANSRKKEDYKHWRGSRFPQNKKPQKQAAKTKLCVWGLSIQKGLNRPVSVVEDWNNCAILFDASIFKDKTGLETVKSVFNKAS